MYRIVSLLIPPIWKPSVSQEEDSKLVEQIFHPHSLIQKVSFMVTMGEQLKAAINTSSSS